MSKVLIYMPESELKPVGGPRGYLYNLKKQLDLINVDDIDFIKSNSREKIVKYRDKIGGMKKGFIKSILLILKRCLKFGLLIYGNKHKSIVDISAYDVVHFHSSYDMYNARDSLIDYKGKVVFSSHSPTLLSLEHMEARSCFERLFCGFIYNKLIRMDQYSFNRADYIVFPCPEAEEPYFNNWSEYAKIKKIKKSQYRYVVTGINKCKIKVPKDEIRKKYSIPRNAFVISYVGRHNQIKGYDILKDIGQIILEKHPDVYFLIAGIEKPLKGLANDHWIEVGWTDDPHSIISASDMFILPNRETYFDLVLLEVLSIGQIVLASNTGGNKHFINNKGIILYDTMHEAIIDIEEILNLGEEKREEMRFFNSELFEKSYNSRLFAENYIKLYSSLI